MNRNRRFKFSIRKGIMVFVIVILAASLLSFIIMSLWNAILPGVLHVSAITFPQALGILVLSKILFGGFGRRGWRGAGGPPNFMQQKFANMTPEERERFKQQWQNKCRSGNFKETKTPQNPDQTITN